MACSRPRQYCWCSKQLDVPFDRMAPLSYPCCKYSWDDSEFVCGVQVAFRQTLESMGRDQQPVLPGKPNMESMVRNIQQVNISHQEIDRLLKALEELYTETKANTPGMEWMPVQGVGNLLCHELGCVTLHYSALKRPQTPQNAAVNALVLPYCTGCVLSSTCCAFPVWEAGDPMLYCNRVDATPQVCKLIFFAGRSCGSLLH